MAQHGKLIDYPEVLALMDVPQDPQWHPEGDVWTHTCLVCDAAAHIAGRQQLNTENRQVLLLAALCHDLGKPQTTKMSRGRWRSRGHCQAGVVISRQFLQKIACSITIQTVIEPLVNEHLSYVQAGTAKAVKRLIKRLHPASIEQLLWLVEADCSGRPPLPKGLPDSAIKLREIAHVID